MKCCPESIKMTLNKIFSCTILSRASRKTFYRVLTWAVLPWGYLRQHWTGFFPVNYCPEPQGQHWLDNIPMQCWELLEQHCSGFLHIKCCAKSIGQYWTGFFHMQCCVKPQGQHCIRFFLCNVFPGDDTLGTILHR